MAWLRTIAFVAALVWMAWAGRAQAIASSWGVQPYSDASAPTGANVLVVYNSSWIEDQDSNGVQDSLQVAQAYRDARAVPTSQVCGVAVSTYEQINLNIMLGLRSSVQSCLVGLGDIRYILLVKGMPLRVHFQDPAYTPQTYNNYDYMSVDSDLTLLGQPHGYWYLGQTSIGSNPYHYVDVPEYSLRHRFRSGWYGSERAIIQSNPPHQLQYLVTRLDAPQLATVLAMIQRSLAPADLGQSVAVLDDRPDITDVIFFDFMQEASNRLGAMAAPFVPIPFVTAYGIPPTTLPVWAYVGHGQDAATPVGALTFAKANGAIYHTWESWNVFSLRETLDPNSYTPMHQTWCSQWLETGGTACIGNVEEPFGFGIPRESIYLPALYAGYPFADAAYMSLFWLTSPNVVVGDPLMTFTHPNDVNPPYTPTQLVAAPAPLQVSLAWVGSVSNDVAGYRVYRAAAPITAADGAGVSLVATLGSTAASYVDAGLTAFATYHYGLVAYDGAGNVSPLATTSAAAQTDDVTPPVLPATFTATGGGNQVQLQWTLSASSDVQLYYYYWALSPFISVPDAAVLGQGFRFSATNSVTIPGLATGTTYYFGLRVRDRSSNFSSLAFVSASTASDAPPLDVMPPAPPQALAAAAGNQQVALSWAASPSGDVASYQLFRSTQAIVDPLAAPTVSLGIVDAGARSYTSAGLSSSTVYYFAVRAVDADGNVSPLALTSASTLGGTPPLADTTPPLPPAALSAAPQAYQVALSWAASPSGDVAGYQLFRSLSSIASVSGGGVSNIANVVAALPFFDIGRTPATRYHYAVRAVDTAGNVSGLATVSAVTLGAPTSSAPTGTAPSGGGLVKASSAAVYYRAADGRRYAFPNESIFLSWYDDFSSVVTVSDAELASYPIGGNVRFRPGVRLVKITTDPKVYAVTPGGELRWVPSEAVAAALYGPQWSRRVADLPDTLFVPPNHSIGQPLASGELPAGFLARASNGDIYYISPTGRRLIGSDSVRRSLRWRLADVLQVSPASLDAVPLAAPLGAAEEQLRTPQ